MRHLFGRYYITQAALRLKTRASPNARRNFVSLNFNNSNVKKINMKTILKVSLIFSMMICLNTYGQHKKGPLNQDNISDSRKELKRDKSIHDNATHAAKLNEHSSRKKHKMGVRLFHHPPKRKSSKQTKETTVINEKKK
jgi:hypothetical protein